MVALSGHFEFVLQGRGFSHGWNASFKLTHYPKSYSPDAEPAPGPDPFRNFGGPTSYFLLQFSPFPQDDKAYTKVNSAKQCKGRQRPHRRLYVVHS